MSRRPALCSGDILHRPRPPGSGDAAATTTTIQNARSIIDGAPLCPCFPFYRHCCLPGVPSRPHWQTAADPVSNRMALIFEVDLQIARHARTVGTFSIDHSRPHFLAMIASKNLPWLGASRCLSWNPPRASAAIEVCQPSRSHDSPELPDASGLLIWQLSALPLNESALDWGIARNERLRSSGAEI